MTDFVSIMQEISRILSKYGEAPEEAEKNETAFPKLLNCLQEMERRIESPRAVTEETVRDIIQQIAELKNQCIGTKEWCGQLPDPKGSGL